MAGTEKFADDEITKKLNIIFPPYFSSIPFY